MVKCSHLIRPKIFKLPPLKDLSIDSVNFNEDNEESNYVTRMNYQTVRRIDKQKMILRNHSLLFISPFKAGTNQFDKGKAQSKIESNMDTRKEAEIFSPSGDPPTACRDYTIVTPSHTFIEIDIFLTMEVLSAVMELLEVIKHLSWFL